MMYEYKCKIIRVIDGDTVDVDIDLGFGVWLKKERVRMLGIDTPESRTRDKVEKLFGLTAKEFIKDLMPVGSIQVLKTEIDRSGEDKKGKFGRILGDFLFDADVRLTDLMIEAGHAVAYFGGNKDEIQLKHEANRQKLLREDVVSKEEYNKAVAIMEKHQNG